jgi:CheY-like chemotaxis protein
MLTVSGDDGSPAVAGPNCGAGHPAPCVLVVDDDEATVAFMADALELDGLTVQSAGDGVEALAWLEHRPVDLIVHDAVRPVMGAEAFAAEDRRRAGGRVGPIVLVSATRADHLPEIAVALGAVAYLAKPFDLEQFLAIVQEVLASRASSRTC